MDDFQIENLRSIDKASLTFFKSQLSYENFVREKEIKTNHVLLPSEESEYIDDDLELEESDGEQVNKLDLDKAYEMYMSKKEEILKNFE